VGGARSLATAPIDAGIRFRVWLNGRGFDRSAHRQLGAGFEYEHTSREAQLALEPQPEFGCDDRGDRRGDTNGQNVRRPKLEPGDFECHIVEYVHEKRPFDHPTATIAVGVRFGFLLCVPFFAFPE
jgi:hypothetical protein